MVHFEESIFHFNDFLLMERNWWKISIFCWRVRYQFSIDIQCYLAISFFFLATLQHMGAPKPEIRSKAKLRPMLQLWLCQAREWTCVLALQRHLQSCCTTVGTPAIVLAFLVYSSILSFFHNTKHLNLYRLFSLLILNKIFFFSTVYALNLPLF